MHMIKAKMPLNDFALFLPGQFVKYLAKIMLQLTIQNLSSTLWDPNHMILAVPYRMA